MSGSKKTIMKIKLAMGILCVSVSAFTGCGGEQTGGGAESETVQATAAGAEETAAGAGETAGGAEETAAGAGETTADAAGTTAETRPGSPAGQEAVLLKEAPEISLTDVLSSTMNEYKVRAGNYTWSYRENGEILSLAACGMHPLEKVEGEEEHLKIPKYNRLDAVSYSLSCAVLPDSVMVTEWEASQLGNPEAAPVSTAVYSNDSLNSSDTAFLIELKPDRIYELYAVWKEDKLETNGFYGEAGYVVMTQNR